ncbi:MAG: LPS export ABC transporter periplasmic protein LptC, partial [Proteobacteria bacterium]|nr:LPS export ABC transporter periplasmic protein LptC [Pseudomonadota bacterium]
KKQTIIENITGQIFTKNGGSDPIRVKAKKGTLNNRSNHLTLEKNVYISFTDGSNIDTEHLVIDLQNERIFNQHQVLLKSRSGKVVGSNMEFDIKASNLKLKQITMNIPFD